MEAPSLSLPAVIFPRALLDDLAEKDQLIDKQKIAYMTLLISNMEESVRAFKERRLTAFDALVGDYGCERRALRILDLASSERLMGEANALQEVAKRVNEEMKEMRTRLLKRTASDGEAKNFFNQKIRSIRISKEMAYLLQCHLLTFTKMPVGAVREKIDISRLEKLAKGGKIQLQTEDKKRIINLVQAELSALSIAFLQNEARHIVGTVLDFIKQIPSKNGELPIAIACQFYSMKAVVCRLRERGALIVFKKWCVSESDQPIAPLFYRAGTGGLFARVPDEEIKKLPPDMAVVVFEGTVHPQLSREQLAACLQMHEVGEVTLAEVAQGDQFEQGKGLEDFPIPDARKEIESYAARAVEMNCVKNKEAFLWMDHIYCSSLGEACKGGTP